MIIIIDPIDFKKIIHVYPGYPHVGGIVTVIRNVAERQLNMGYNVEILSSETASKSKNEYIGGIYVKRFKFHHIFFDIPGLTFLKEIIKTRNSILHIHGFHDLTSFFSILFADKSNIIIFNTYFHGKSSKSYRDYLLKIYIKIFNVIINKVDAIICVSSFEKNLVIKRLYYPSKKVFIIPAGYEIAKVLKYKWEPIKDGVIKILYVGRIVKHKNVDKLIKSLVYLHSAKLTLIGSGDYEDEIKKIIGELNLDEKIVWKRNLDYEDLLYYYSKSDVFVLPSIYESFGLVVGESLLIGCPTILADSFALTEFIRAGLASPLSVPISSKEIADRIYNVPKQSQRDKALKYFKDWNEIAEMYCHIYITNIFSKKYS